MGADGAWTVEEVPLEARARQTLWVPAAARPETVVLDPRGVFLAEVDFDKPAAEWVTQLAAGGPLIARLSAIRALGERGGDEAVAALGRAVREQPFWGAREEAAGALAEIATPAALAALEPATDDADSRVRSEAIEGLGAFAAGADAATRRRLIERLREKLTGEPSYFVRAAAAAALGEFEDDAETVTPLLVAALRQESHREVVRSAALESLAELDPERAWPHARRLAAYGAPAGSRGEALAALGSIGADDEERGDEAFDLLVGIAKGDRAHRARRGAYRALVALGRSEALPVLDAIARGDVDPQQRGSAAAAAAGLRERLARRGDLARRIEELEREMARLAGELDEVKGERQ